MRDAESHARLVASLQDELVADDLDPPTESAAWNEDKLRAWFEAGGNHPTARLTTENVLIDRRSQAFAKASENDQYLRFETQRTFQGKAELPPLKGKLTSCTTGASAPFGLVFACPHPRFLGTTLETMDSPLPAAIAAACEAAGIPLLRYDHPGVGGSGGSDEITRSESTVKANPYIESMAVDCALAVAYMMRHGNCDQIFIGGASMGWSAAMGALRCAVDASCTGAGFISVATSAKMPKFFKMMMPAAAAEETIKVFYSNHSLMGDRPKLLINGASDPMMKDPTDLEALMPYLHAPTLKLVEGADHLFTGKEAQVAELVVDFIRSA